MESSTTAPTAPRVLHERLVHQFQNLLGRAIGDGLAKNREPPREPLRGRRRHVPARQPPSPAKYHSCCSTSQASPHNSSPSSARLYRAYLVGILPWRPERRNTPRPPFPFSGWEKTSNRSARRRIEPSPCHGRAEGGKAIAQRLTDIADARAAIDGQHLQLELPLCARSPAG